MSNLSELLPTGGGQNAVDFVASGTLSSGQTVALNSNGTVSAVAETNNSGSFASSSVFESAATYGSAASYSASLNRFVVVYTDNGNSNYPTAVAGYVNSSGTFTFGTPLVLNSNQSVANTICCEYQVSTEKFIATWSNTSSTYGIVLTVSGTSISKGSDVIFLGSPCSAYSVGTTYNTSNGKVFFVGVISGSIYGAVLNASGTTFQATGAAVIASADAYGTVCYDSDTQQCIVGYRISTSSFGVVPVNVGATTFTTGTEATGSSGVAAYHGISYDTSAQKALISFIDFTNSNTRSAVVSISGTTASLGTLTQLTTDNIEHISCTYLPTEGVNLVVGRNDTNSGALSSISVTISGTTPSTTGVDAISTSVRDGGITYDSTNGYVLAFYRNDAVSDYGYGYSFTPSYTSTNYTSFIGITADAIADTATGSVNVYGGINEAQSGLTIAADYYVQADGSLSTTTSSVKVGQAISATTINMMDLT